VLVPPFSFLTNHGAVLLCIAEDPRMRMRDIAATVDITERAAQRIVADLIESGYVDRTRVGRRNRYSINPTVEMRHQLQRGLEIGPLLALLQQYPATGPAEEQGRGGSHGHQTAPALV
jgi:DNA-binding IclR family transcriptional regulator